MEKYTAIQNNESIPVSSIPVLMYDEFTRIILELMHDNPARHCVNYFGYTVTEGVKLICCIADDSNALIYISSVVVPAGTSLRSLTPDNHNFERFEREIAENFGIGFEGHPWLKPVRYAHDRANKELVIENYPFLKSEDEELHEVGVGPIHAGIIEPGHFRFICNGEQIMHLEIQLGFQHRGIEKLFLVKKSLAERTVLAESIAGDTTIGHTTAFVNLWESLCNVKPNPALDLYRTIAQELERIAIHTGDLSAICTDIAYQLGNAVYGRLRTPIVNFFQEWCGNRFAKGLIRAGKCNYSFTRELAERLIKILAAYESDFNEITHKFSKLPSALSRMEKTGVVTYQQVLEIGTVGMAAKMSGLSRDIRSSHPYNLYGKTIEHSPVIKHHGDVYSRFQIRKEEIWQSIQYLKRLISDIPEYEKSETELKPLPSMFTISLAEGWRGEICHCAVTDEQGELVIYKIKDPSFHNWMALAQAVRNNEISDFPICNKSFNLSYCGHDL
ncbi:MAG TPA: NADH-quinone oxidoreductase subunit C [Lentimicrobium sp.]|nr:NADH-quinone oxidoreductase subunit C [Lentimicrobium sp.]